MPVFKLQGNRDFDMEVVGESHYQENLEAICGMRKEAGERKLVEACLTMELNNPFDKYAVRVDVNGKQIGHLPKETAREYHQLYEGLKIPKNTQLIVNAQIKGGWIRKNGEKGSYGVWLDFPSDRNGLEQLKSIAVRSKKKNGCFGVSAAILILSGVLLIIGR